MGGNWLFWYLLYSTVQCARLCRLPQGTVLYSRVFGGCIRDRPSQAGLMWNYSMSIGCCCGPCTVLYMYTHTILFMVKDTVKFTVLLYSTVLLSTHNTVQVQFKGRVLYSRQEQGPGGNTRWIWGAYCCAGRIFDEASCRIRKLGYTVQLPGTVQSVDRQESVIVYSAA